MTTLRLPPMIEGDSSGPTLFFIQGWPDNASLWDAAALALRATHRCVRVTLPNFNGEKISRRGYSTEEIISALETVLRDCARDAVGGRVTLVLHDWGCYWGHPLHHRNPTLVDRVASFDVAPHLHLSFAGTLGTITYQWWLLAAFGIGGGLGDKMTRSIANLLKMPNSDTRTLDAWMNYPYRNVWSDIIARRDRGLLKGYWPKCPILFGYGAKKPFNFHSQNWLDHVEKTGGKIVAFPTGHWVQTDPTFPRVLADWLEETKPTTTAAPRAAVVE